MLADYPIKGLQQNPIKDAPGSDISKYLKSPYPSSKSGEIHRVVLIALQTDILYSPLSTISSQQPNFISWLFPATAAADRGGGGLEWKEGSVVVPTEPVPLSLEVCGGDGGGVKVLS
ncbi:hypothetical protein L3X38_004509 [Prunus dulcis]|uniref:Uncharacterized protein n=1 Tax=Prunus dulcis TaxID=3755 RepID=A0AAD5F3C4_PRUDU|nr:hypothetical protein L3X38_004509 [Prunus dulcis]